MSGVQKCEWESTKIEMAANGADLFARWFDLSEADLEAKCGRFVRGARKGKLRGWIVYRKVRVGGWSYPLQCVLRPGMIWAHFCATYDEAMEKANLATDRFFPATRVDSCYGYDRKAEAQAAAARIAAEAAKRAEDEIEERRRIVWDVIDAMEENGASGAAIKAYKNAYPEFVAGGWPQWHAYNAESLALSAAAAGGQIG